MGHRRVQRSDGSGCGLVRAGDRLFLCGLSGSGDAAAQADEAMREARALLQGEGASVAAIGKISGAVTDRAWLAPAQEAVTRHLAGHAPAQCWTVVAGLESAAMLVCLQIDAVVG